MRFIKLNPVTRRPGYEIIFEGRFGEAEEFFSESELPKLFRTLEILAERGLKLTDEPQEFDAQKVYNDFEAEYEKNGGKLEDDLDYAFGFLDSMIGMLMGPADWEHTHVKRMSFNHYDEYGRVTPLKLEV